MASETEQSDDVLPRKRTAEEIKQKRMEAYRRLLEEHSRCERHIELLEKRLVEVGDWLELDKTSVKQKHYQLYKVAYQLDEQKKKYTQLQRAIDYRHVLHMEKD